MQKEFIFISLLFLLQIFCVKSVITFTKNLPKTKQPNIVFILTDDQDVMLQGMTPMVKVKKLLKEQGITFNNMFATTPLCCPSRTSILTGRYVHNHGTVNNSISGNCSSPYWQKHLEQNTMAVQIQKAGYKTYFAGKYLNQYGRPSSGGSSHVPPGWDDWFGLIGNSRYYNYSVSNNGVEQKHGDRYNEDYLTDVLKNRSIEKIKDHKILNSPFPFFLMISTPAPHSPWNSAPQYSKRFDDQNAPQTPSFNKYGKDKHWLIRQAKNPMANSSISYLNEGFRGRWRTLLSVDDLVESVINTLEQEDFLKDTYIIYTSDNGYHLGQFSLPIDKRQMYDFDLRVPLIVRGPDVGRNVTRNEIVLNIDLAPTLVDIATGGKTDASMDGASFKPLFNASNQIKWRSDFAVEYRGESKLNQPGCPTLGPGVSQCFPDCICEDASNNTYGCVRTLQTDGKNLMYCEFSDSETFVEVYDLEKDPHQLTNIIHTVDPELLVEMNKRLIQLSFCQGDTCRHPSIM